jgi:hypothetical protein
MKGNTGPYKGKGRVRFHGGVSILCWPVTPAVRPQSKLGVRDYPSSKPVWKWQSNKGYETNHSTYGPVIHVICNRKQGHYSDRRICEMMTLNEIRYNPATSNVLSVVGLVLKSSHTQNMLLQIESTGRYSHHKQVKVVYYYIEKGS